MAPRNYKLAVTFSLTNGAGLLGVKDQVKRDVPAGLARGLGTPCSNMRVVDLGDHDCGFVSYYWSIEVYFTTDNPQLEKWGGIAQGKIFADINAAIGLVGTTLAIEAVMGRTKLTYA